MREIKFKVVWNNQVSIDGYTIGEFLDGVELEFLDGGTLPMGDIDWGKDKVEYIQFTGFKDKNGKEIYEDDLVILDLGAAYGGPFQIVWGDGCWLVQGKGYLTSKETDDMKIVGDIYMNPELLK